MSPTYRTPFTASCPDDEDAPVFFGDTREEAVDYAVAWERERLADDGEDEPLTIHVDLYIGAEWCPEPDPGEPCACGLPHVDRNGDSGDAMIGHASRETVQHHRYSAADLAAHLRERDDLREVLEAMKVAVWRDEWTLYSLTDEIVAELDVVEGRGWMYHHPDTDGGWYATEAEARAAVEARAEADGWRVLR